MAELINQKCGNCGNPQVYFCSNEFTDFLCWKCGAINLSCTLMKIEFVIPCINKQTKHDIRIARKGPFCIKCNKYLIDEPVDPLLPFYTGDFGKSWFYNKEDKTSRSPTKNV